MACMVAVAVGRRPPPAGRNWLLTAWPGCPGAARRPRPASSAGRIGGGQPPAHAPARAAEGEVGHGGEALLVGAQRQQQVGDAIAAGQGRVVDAARSSSRTRRPPGRTSSAPAGRRARRRGARARARARSARAARARRGRRGRRAGRPSAPRRSAGARLGFGAHDVGPALGVELGDDPGVGEAGQASTGSASGWTQERAATPAARNGTTWATVIASTARPRGRRRARVDARAPVDGGELGERLGGHRSWASRRRSAGA